MRQLKGYYGGMIKCMFDIIFFARRRTMKKVLQLGLIVLVTLGLTFTACEQPFDKMTTTDTSSTTTFVGLHTLPAPEDVTATAYGPTGVIRVSWSAVANADGYHLYRRSVDSKKAATVKKLGGTFTGINGGSDLFFDDIISFSNEFESGASYSYRVVAFSNYASTSTTSPQSAWTNLTESDWFFIQNSSADSNTVKFSNLLSQGSKLAKPSNIKLTQGYSYNVSGIYGRTQVMQVSWSVEPAVNYIVSYGYAGKDNTNTERTLSYYVNSVGGDQKTYALEVPLVFGEVLVEVVARSKVGSLNTTSVTGGSSSAAYYLDSDPAVATYTFARTILDKPTSFIETENNFVVDLSWDKMNDADAYKVYRYKYSSTSPYNNGGTQIYEGWKDITAEINYREEGPLVYGQDNLADLYNAESNTNAGDTYRYMVISVKGDTVSLPATANVTKTYTMPALNVSFFTSDWDIQTKDWKPISISWTAQGKETYKLYRTAMKRKDGSALYEPFEADAKDFIWTEIPLTGIEADLSDGKTHWLSDKPEYRKSYRYKLESYAPNSTAPKGTAYSTTVSAYPYSFALDIALQVNNDNADTPDAYGILYRLAASDIDQLQKVMKATEMVRISRAPATKAGERTGDYTKVKDLYLSNFKDSLDQYKDETGWEPDYPGIGTFIYRAEILDSGSAMSAQFYNGGAVADAAYVTESASDPTWNLSGTPTAFTRNGQIALSYSNLPENGINKAKLYVRYTEGLGGVSQSNYKEAELVVDTKKDGSVFDTYTYETTAIPTTPGEWSIDVYVLPGDFETGTLDTITPQSLTYSY